MLFNKLKNLFKLPDDQEKLKSDFDYAFGLLRKQIDSLQNEVVLLKKENIFIKEKSNRLVKALLSVGAEYNSIQFSLDSFDNLKRHAIDEVKRQIKIFEYKVKKAKSCKVCEKHFKKILKKIDCFGYKDPYLVKGNQNIKKIKNLTSSFIASNDEFNKMINDFKSKKSIKNKLHANTAKHRGSNRRSCKKV